MVSDDALGAGESGKTTILKQMRITHNKGFSADERISFKQVLYANLLSAFQIIVDIIEDEEIELGDPEITVRILVFFHGKHRLNRNLATSGAGKEVAGQHAP